MSFAEVRIVRMLLSLSAATLLIALAAAPASSQEDLAELEFAWEVVNQTAQLGPGTVTLGEQAGLELPEHMAFVPPEAGALLMRAYGNEIDESFLGLLMPVAEDEYWFITVEYIPSGFIRDDDARDWDANELLEDLRAGTREGNEFRRSKGIPPLEVKGWVEAPSYDASRHQLVWSVRLKDVGAAASPEDTVNYNTYVLGRRGYISMNLVTSQAEVESQKPMAKLLLANTRFNPGLGYEDFNASTDRVAAYGLAALVGGAAAKKAGLFGAIAVFLAKAWKLVLIGLVALFGPLLRVFRRKTA